MPRRIGWGFARAAAASYKFSGFWRGETEINSEHLEINSETEISSEHPEINNETETETEINSENPE